MELGKIMTKQCVFVMVLCALSLSTCKLFEYSYKLPSLNVLVPFSASAAFTHLHIPTRWSCFRHSRWIRFGLFRGILQRKEYKPGTIVCHQECKHESYHLKTQSSCVSWLHKANVASLSGRVDAVATAQLSLRGLWATATEGRDVGSH